MRQREYGNYIDEGAVASHAARIFVGISMLACLVGCLGRSALAQVSGSVAADRARLDSLRHAVRAPEPVAGGSLQIVLPDVRYVWNSAIPYSMNDGPLWAGRGSSVSVTTGAAASIEQEKFGVRVVAAPTLVYSANRPFDVIPGREPGRSTYSSPFHLDSASADLPLRFGDASLRSIGLGESSITVRYSNVALGASSAAEWWGPAIRNALVLSDNAGGIPRFFIRTARPARTGFGDITAEALTGTLTESLFFDSLTTNDFRSVAGFIVTFRPRLDSGLSFGVTRMMYRPSGSSSPSFGLLGQLVRWAPAAAADDKRHTDQIASVFADWRLFESGLEIYGEFARMELPRSLGEFLRTPQNTAGYTLGLQWLVRRYAGGMLRLQGETTFLDQQIFYLDRPPLDFYTGRVAPQGYTQRGQVLGAAIGPGGSSQWAAMDFVAPRWQGGVFLGHTRFENDALYRESHASFFDHDADINSGLRGAVRFAKFDLSSELTVSRRLNYLFRSGFGNPNDRGRVDIQNITLATRISPR